MVRIRVNEPPSKRELRKMYVTEQLGSGDIAERVGIPRSSVQYWLRKYEIPLRSKSESARLREAKPEFAAWRSRQLLEAQTKITPEGRRRQAIAISGPREPWSDEVRAKHQYRSDPEYRQRISDAQKGPKAHNWKGGATPEEYVHLNSWGWREARKRCYERDQWICQDCGVHCLNGVASKRDPKRKIQAHHIVSRRDGGTDDLTNLITLCVSCHQRRERFGT